MRTFIALCVAFVLPAAQEDRSKSPEAKKKYEEQMKIVGAENKGLKADAGKKDFSKVQERLAKMRAAAEAARKIDYLKDASQKEDFDSYFEIFLEAKLGRLQQETWDAGSFDELYERLQASCRTCHEAFRD